MSRSLNRASDPVRFVLVAGLVGIIALFVAYVAVDRLAGRSTSQASTTQIDSTTHPVLTVRRAPTTLSFTSRLGSVRRAMANVTSRLPSGACFRVDWMGETLSSVKSDTPFIPASASKILTAAVALEVLGPTYTFETQVFSDPLSSTGSVANLYLVGGGDPVLVRSDYPATEKYPTINPTAIEGLVNSIVAAGVSQVTQAINVIDNRYDQIRYLDIWPSSFYGVEAGPLGALMVNDSTVVDQPGRQDDPAIASGSELSVLLARQGIVSSSSIQRIDSVPATATKIASVTSAPLTAIIEEMLVNSDNNTSELLLKEMGFAKKGSGTTQSGLEVVSETIAKWGLGSTPTIVDGSGLSSSNSMTCDVFASLLEQNKDVLPPLMSVAGETGTLKTFFVDSPMEGRMVAKTGTLTGVKSLVGYLPLDEEEDVKFALLMNSSGIDNQNSFRPIWNSLAEALNRASATPRPEDLIP